VIFPPFVPHIFTHVHLFFQYVHMFPPVFPSFSPKNGNVPSFYISSLHLFLSIYFPYDLGVDPLPMTPTFRASPIHRSGCGSCMSKSSITARRPVVLHPWKINGQSMDNQLMEPSIIIMAISIAPSDLVKVMAIATIFSRESQYEYTINGHFRILDWRYLPYIRPM